MSLSAAHLRIQLPLFEGPLALLLYLIRKEEMDIMNIKIHQITQQYFEYIKMMKEMDLEIAGEFVSMAATLIQIKSQILLPHYNDQGEEVEAQDPRKELVQKLLEYQKYQQGAALLSERPWLGREVFSRCIKEKLETQEPEVSMEEDSLFALIASFRKIIRSAEKRVHQVSKKLQSIAGRIVELRDFLPLHNKISLRSLLGLKEGSSHSLQQELLITFLSCLEMAKMGFVRLFQNQAFDEIYIEAFRNLEELSLSSVEEYEAQVQKEHSPQKEQNTQNIQNTQNPHGEQIPFSSLDDLTSLEDSAILETSTLLERSTVLETYDLLENERTLEESPSSLEKLSILKTQTPLEGYVIQNSIGELGQSFFIEQTVATDEDIDQAEQELGLKDL
jgi:segregation and condensation protein A